jgi:hypothetical protein
VFEEKEITIKEMVEARKNKIEGDEAWQLIRTADEVIIGKGKKFHSFTPSDETRDEILKNALGRTGNLRAPALKLGNIMIIGFNDEMYEQHIN